MEDGAQDGVKVAGIYMAAGSSRRMGEAKLNLELEPGMPLGAAALRALAASGAEPLIVVVREENSLPWLHAMRESLERRPLIAVCTEAHLGMSHSLRCGVGAALAAGADAALIVLGDQPFVGAPLLRGLAERYREGGGLDYVASGNGGTAMPPAVIGRSMFPAVERLEGDKGARGLFQNPDFHGEIVEMSEREVFLDADTKEDLEEIRLHWARLREQAQ